MRINGSHSGRSIVKAGPTGVPFHFRELDVYRDQFIESLREPRKSYRYRLTRRMTARAAALFALDV